jgi:hypothetical protein
MQTGSAAVISGLSVLLARLELQALSIVLASSTKRRRVPHA